MTVSAGVGGGSVVGVVLGGGAFTGGGGTITSNAAAAPAVVANTVGTLPFTGAGHLMTMVAVAIVLLVVGALTVGLAKRASDDALLDPA